MKNLLLYANDDAGLESRLQAAFDVARAFGAHISCVQATPFEAFLVGDPFGGIYAIPTVMQRVDEASAANRARVEERMRREGVTWDGVHYDGAPAQVVVASSRLSDLIVLSLPGGASGPTPPLAGDVAVHAGAPVLAVPEAGRGIDCAGTALVAWNGSPEPSHAARAAVPMLKLAGEVAIVTVTGELSEFPATDAAEYLARHGIEAKLHEWPKRDLDVAEALLDAADRLGAAYVVMGAYGHSRLRETVFGGATRDMLNSGKVPLLLAR